jgi:3-deoxy-7-phosphoheptulonate synthase
MFISGEFQPMIVIMKSGTPAEEIERVSQEMRNWNITPEKTVGYHKVVIGLVGDTAALNAQQIQTLSPFIERVMRVEQPFKRASREFRHGEPSSVFVETPNGFVAFGENHPIVQVAGPCSVEI